MRDYCPCDQCNGRLTGAWEDEESYPSQDVDLYYNYSDPYEGYCCACLEELTPDHTMYNCPEPVAWSEYYRIQKSLVEIYLAFFICYNVSM